MVFSNILFVFTPNPGEMIQLDKQNFSNGLVQAPTSEGMMAVSQGSAHGWQGKGRRIGRRGCCWFRKAPPENNVWNVYDNMPFYNEYRYIDFTQYIYLYVFT